MINVSSLEARSFEPIADLHCTECKNVRSRRTGVVVTVRNRRKYICGPCCIDLYADGLGYDRWTLAYFLSGGAQA